MESVIERVATDPTQGDVAVLTTGRVRYTVRDAGGMVETDREETFRGQGDQLGHSDVKRVAFSPDGWKDLVRYGAVTVQTKQAPPKAVKPTTAPPPQKKGLFGGLFGSS